MVQVQPEDLLKPRASFSEQQLDELGRITLLSFFPSAPLHALGIEH